MAKYEKNYWLNEESRKFLSRDYLLPGQTPEERIKEIAYAAEKILGIEGYAEKLIEYVELGYIAFSTPIWLNFGNDRGLPISCFNSHISDSVESFLIKQAEVGYMTKNAGGTSGYFGDVRPRGSKISKGGIAEGPVRAMELFNNVTSIISQGAARRGHFAAYLPIDHADIEEFLQIQDVGHTIQEMSIGVCISDAWMQSMVDGDKAKRALWGKVIKKRFETGYPYIFFTDTANDLAPKWYREQGMKINSSNMCVTGNQRVVSSQGLVTAKELYDRGESLQLFDNEKVVSASPMKLIEKDADVYRVTLSNGMTHDITGYHKIVVSEKDHNGKENERNVECSDLKIGNRVKFQTNKGIFGKQNRPDEAFLLGLYQADGTQHKDTIMLDIWENDFDLIPEIEEKFERIHYGYQCDTYLNTNQTGKKFKCSIGPAKFHDCTVNTGTVAKKRLASKTLKKALNFEKGYVPYWIWEADEQTQWQYIRGLLYADGSVGVSKNSFGEPIQITLSNINKEFLREIQILLANLGINCSIKILRQEGKTLLPNGQGDYNYYDTKDCWRLIVGNKNDALIIEKETGFLSRKGFALEDRDYRDNTKKYSKIVSIEYIGKEDVFCCTVDSEEHLWVCNGFVTHNCTEIFLPSTADESFVCDLAPMNLLHFDEWKHTDAVKVAIYLLDAVMTEFIQKTEHMPLMAAPRRFAIRHRALGLGGMGWHSYLKSKMIPWESLEAMSLNNTIWKFIREQAEEATLELGKLFGPCEVCANYDGRRNATLLAIAPNTSSSTIHGQPSPGIEPDADNYFVKILAKGNITYRCQQLTKFLQAKGYDTPEIWKSILENGGSVQHLKILTDHEKAVFKTFGEITQRSIIDQAAQRQPRIDQGQSLNTMMHPETKPKEASDLYIYAWKTKKIKSLYYQRGGNPAQRLAREINKCVSCES